MEAVKQGSATVGVKSAKHAVLVALKVCFLVVATSSSVVVVGLVVGVGALKVYIMLLLRHLL